MKIIVQRDDGTEEDVTFGVQVAFDTAWGSMDWGSGFLDSEEMGQIARLAVLADFPCAAQIAAEVTRSDEPTLNRPLTPEERAEILESLPKFPQEGDYFAWRKAEDARRKAEAEERAQARLRERSKRAAEGLVAPPPWLDPNFGRIDL